MQATWLHTSTYSTLMSQDWLTHADLPFTEVQRQAINDCLRLIGTTPGYTKKDGNNLPVSIISTETACYLLFKTHFGHQKTYGSYKTGTPALQIPHDRQNRPKMVYQLVTRDEIPEEQQELIAIECQEQAHLARKGICPNILDLVEYIKCKNDNSRVKKRAIFVEAFDSDLKAFDPGQSREIDKEDPRPFALSDEQVLFIAHMLATHLDALHQKNYVYRDLCLENVGLSYDRRTQTIKRVFLCDLGTLTSLHAKEYTPLKAYGHIEYTAPEYFRGDAQIDEKACDIYAYGILLAMLLQPNGEEFEPWEPSWINEFPAIFEQAAKFCDPIERLNFLLTHPTNNEIREEQEAYIPLAIPHPEQGAKVFLQSLIGITLHPDPKNRPTAQQLILYFKEFQLHTQNMHV